MKTEKRTDNFSNNNNAECGNKKVHPFYYRSNTQPVWPIITITCMTKTKKNKQFFSRTTDNTAVAENDRFEQISNINERLKF